MNILVFINVVIFFVTHNQFVINIKLRTPDVFRHNTEASTIQCMYIHTYIHTCNKKDLLTTNFTGIVPSLDCSNTVTDGSCLSAAALYNFSGNSSSEAVYKLLPNWFIIVNFKADLAESILVDFQM
jgi:hypothetical protein